MAYEQELSNIQALTIGATAVEISGIKPRKLIYIRNTSAAAQVLTIAFDNFNPAVAGSGIILSAGEAVTDSTTAGYKCWGGKISAVASAAGGTISFMELKED